MSNCHRSSVSPVSTDLMARTIRDKDEESSHSIKDVSDVFVGCETAHTLDLIEDSRDVFLEFFVRCHKHGQAVLFYHPRVKLSSESEECL